MSEVYGKGWGTTSPILITPFFEFHRIMVEPYRMCSLHYHKYKYNAFYVVEGNLVVRKFLDAKNLTPGHPTELSVCVGPQQLTIVEPNTLHQFETIDDRVEAFELYWPQGCQPSDIVRVVRDISTNTQQYLTED